MKRRLLRFFVSFVGAGTLTAVPPAASGASAATAGAPASLREDFSAGMEDWWTEGGERVWAEDGRLNMSADAPERPGGAVATAWWRRELPADFELEFDAHVVSSSADANNINLFLCYADPSGRPLEETREPRRNAEYKLYHQLEGYIVTFVKENGEARVRIRRNPGFQLLAEHRGGENRPGVTHRFRIRKQGGVIVVAIDGAEVARAEDPTPWGKGLLGLRTFRTRLWWNNLRVRSLKPVRTVSEVDAAGRKIVESYSDAQLASWGFLDVTKAPYSADPSGERDCTEILQRAVNDARDARLIAYLPAGRYRVSNTIEGVVGTVLPDHFCYEGFADPWVAHRSFDYPCVIAGPSEGGRATIVLADRAPGFGDPSHPRPVLHFWARSMVIETPFKSQSNINFNQKILSLDFELGEDNPGAVAIDHRGAEGSTIEDITIRATGAFAGIVNAPGSGGAMHAIRVSGGRYGLHLPGSQPSPLVSDLLLEGQTEAAIHYRGRGPLTVVGADIRGAPVVGGLGASHWDGAINLIDCVIRVDRSGPAITTPRSVVLDKVWFERTAVAASIADHPPVRGNPDGWTHVVHYAAGGRVDFPKALGGGSRRDAIWLDGTAREEPRLQVGEVKDGPPADVVARHRFPRLPNWFSAETANVRQPPWNAVGDGKQDDTEALQAAVDAHHTVFLPKGVYRLSRPLRLRANTTLVGVTNLLSVLTCAAERGGAFDDVDRPQPLVETRDDARARTTLAMLKLELPVLNPCVYALHWRAGRSSVVRNLYPIRTAWHPDAPVLGTPMIQIDGNGGGRWYTQTLLGWWSQGPDYRHLLATGTREPLRFYHLQPQHGRSEVMVEFNNVEDLEVYSMKTEGNYMSFWIRDSRRVRLFGFSGNAAPRPGWPVFRLDNVRDYRVAGIYPQVGGMGRVGALGIGYHPHSWLLLRDGAITIRGDEQFVLYEDLPP